jgi:hypothetical protein
MGVAVPVLANETATISMVLAADPGLMLVIDWVVAPLTTELPVLTIWMSLVLACTLSGTRNSAAITSIEHVRRLIMKCAPPFGL